MFRCRRVDVFTIYILGFGHECASAVTAAGVAFFESVKLVFLLEEIEEMHIRGLIWCW